MKQIILPIIIVAVGLFAGCRYGCTPYDNCGPIFSNPHNCDTNYRSGSVFNNAAAPIAAEGVIEAESPVPETIPGLSVPAGSTVPAPAAAPAPSSVPAPANGAPLETIELEEIPTNSGVSSLPVPATAYRARSIR